MRDIRSELHNMSHDLVSEDDGQSRRRRSAFDLIKLRMADTARCNLDENLAWTRLRYRQVHQLQRRASLR